jgi:16S rRNA (guanine(1405)-N(7))-methyltransferase
MDAPEVRDFCWRMLEQHASTRERMPILEKFYDSILTPLGSIESVLDLACGLNPLARPWMQLQPSTMYYACDIYADMIAFLNRFMDKMALPGKAWLCDLVQEVPQQPVQLALVLKTIPCLEQIDKRIGRRLLEGLQAEYILVSFPVQSLGGRNKGMVENYEAHFREIVEGFDWQIERHAFSAELAFLIKK